MCPPLQRKKDKGEGLVNMVVCVVCVCVCVVTLVYGKLIFLRKGACY